MAELRGGHVMIVRGDIRTPTKAEERRAQRRGKTGAAQFRPYRNGLPEFRPYIYNGRGPYLHEEAS